MANPEASLPVDPDVKVPPSVAAAAAAAEAAHRAAYPVAEPPTVAEVPVAEPPPAPEPQANGSQIPDSGENGSWEHRYHAMRGRYEQAERARGSLEETTTQLAEELQRTQHLLRQPQENRYQKGQQRPGQAPRQLVTQEDVNTYGHELIDLVRRAALETVAPDIMQTRQAVQSVAERVGQSAQQDMLTILNREVPNWEQINIDGRFKVWCSLPDIYSGHIRANLLNQAFQAADAPRVVAFFRGFLAEEQATGQRPSPQVPQPATPPREAAVDLGTLAAPGRPKPAGGGVPTVADKPIFTRGQISAFYADVARGLYRGREQDQANLEAAIIAAGREGRVR